MSVKIVKLPFKYFGKIDAHYSPELQGYVSELDMVLFIFEPHDLFLIFK